MAPLNFQSELARKLELRTRLPNRNYSFNEIDRFGEFVVQYARITESSFETAEPGPDVGPFALFQERIKMQNESCSRVGV